MSEVNLTNCDREPIHIPGSIQPHGALITFDENGIVAFHSQNFESLLGVSVGLGEKRSDTLFKGNPELSRAVNRVAGMRGDRGRSHTVEIGGKPADVFGHLVADSGHVVVEIEPYDQSAPELHTFAIEAHRSMSRIAAIDDVDDLIELTTEAIKDLTGYDRVMCYQFLHDESGSVVAEAKEEELESFFGLRYPASDIPQQARLLYVKNLLRFIADVNAVPTPVVPECGPEANFSLDLSKSSLRSVSPIHIEYLKNMGVTASMSVSIVIDGKLWGLFACHHYSGAKWVPKTVRVSCEVVAQMFSVQLKSLLSEHAISVEAEKNSILSRYLKAVQNGSDFIHGLSEFGALNHYIDADCIAVTYDGQLMSNCVEMERKAIGSVIGALEEQAERLVQTSHLKQDFPELTLSDDYAGFLAVNFSRESSAWVIFFRKQEVENIRWAGNPDKVYSQGPNGSRLSPRGSFEEYLQVVQGRCSPWTDSDQRFAEILRTELQSLELERITELERARRIMVASLSHDLRNPLFAIRISANLLDDQEENKEELGNQIKSSSTRMQRLVDQMLDYNRIESGEPLVQQRIPVDISQLINELSRETRAAYPGFEVSFVNQTSGPVSVDVDRFGQVLANLLSNARHHGRPGHPAELSVSGGGSDPFMLRVSNHAEEIPEETLEVLFNAFKGGSSPRRNRRGLGLGLYIVHKIVTEHGGTIELEPYDGRVSFTVTIPPE